MAMQIDPTTGKGDPSVIRINVTVPYEEEKKEVLATAKKLFAIRNGIPFDTWFFNYIDAPKILPSTGVVHYLTSSDLQRKPCSARLWAAWALTESVIRATIESATYVMRRILFKEKPEGTWRNLQAQVSSIILSGTAIISPDFAKNCFLEYWERQEVRETFKKAWETQCYDYNAISQQLSYMSKSSG